MLRFVHQVRVWIFCALACVVLLSAIAYFMKESAPPAKQTQEIVQAPMRTTHAVIGTSVEGRPIDAYTFGYRNNSLSPVQRHVVFVGGVHGGYEWNSVVLAYKALDYINVSQNQLPNDVLVTVVPSLNPDGVFAVVGKEGRIMERDIDKKKDTSVGRVNANGVDLNRNFGCKWQPEAQWRGKKIGAGDDSFSEPESQALRSFVETQRANSPHVALEFIFWHSQANAVYASECTEGILPETRTLMNTYARAAGYKSIASFDAYPVTGDAEGWLASIGIPAITVELSTHDTIEWEKNKKGIDAVIHQ